MVKLSIRERKMAERRATMLERRAVRRVKEAERDGYDYCSETYFINCLREVLGLRPLSSSITRA